MAALVSMAKAISSTLPSAPSLVQGATNAVKSAVGGTKDGIPAQLRKGLDVEALEAVESVEVDGTVLIKILKHFLDNPNSETSGQLLGLDLNSVLEVSDCFAFPQLPASERGADEEKERAAGRAAHQAYATEMLRSLRQVSLVDSPVGAYFTSPTGSFFKIALVEAISVYQAVGGRKGVVLLHDPARSAQGSVSVRAFRFSSAFSDAVASGGAIDTQTLVDHRLTFSNLLEELPLTITNSSLINAYLSTISLPSTSSSSSSLSDFQTPLLAPSHLPALNLNFPSSLTSSLEKTSRALDEFQRESNALSYNARDIARHQVRVDQLVASGVSEEEAKRQVRVPKEQSRTQSLMLLRQVEEFAQGMTAESGSGVAKMYAVAK